MDIEKHNGKMIADKRIALGLSQDELAKKLNYSSRTSINKIESGQNKVPDKKIELFESVLGIKLLKNVEETLSPKFYKEQTIEKMKNLGTYHESYDDLINVYSELMFDYYQARKMYYDNGMQITALTEEGNLKKAPYMTTIENMRKDLVVLSDRLLLNPKMSSQPVEAPTKAKSKLELLFE